MRKYYLVTTEHLEETLWFRDDEDFATGMNYVAVQAALVPEVTVIAFILMSNHVHFVLYGTRAEGEAFVNSIKGRYSQYLRCRYGAKRFLKRNRLDMTELSEEEPESLERAVAYVQMNCVAANICLQPGQYPWGTGSVFFQAGWEEAPARKGWAPVGGVAGRPAAVGRRIGDLSGRERTRLLHSRVASMIPDGWLISEKGFVLPESYVDVAHVESVFRSPKRMQFFLNRSSKARKRLESEEEHVPAFRDQTILGALPDLLQSLFQKPVFRALSVPEQAETLRQIRFRFSAGVHQAARVCGISYAEAARLLDTV